MRLRPLRREPRHRQLHPDRPHHQCDGRRGHDPLLAAPRRQHLIGRRSTSTRRRAAAIKGQKPAVLWFTGLSGSGKSTIANLVEKRLHRARPPHLHARRRQCPPRPQPRLGFTDADRVENIRRVAEAAQLMVDAGLIVLVSFISPFRAERQMARELPGGRRVHRDLRRHAARRVRATRSEGPLPQGAARASSRTSPASTRPTSRRSDPDIHLRTPEMTIEQEVDVIIDALRERGVFD